MNQLKTSENSPSKQTPQPQLQQQTVTWQKPSLRRLRVSLDTAFSFGSGGDGFMATSTSPN